MTRFHHRFQAVPRWMLCLSLVLLLGSTPALAASDFAETRPDSSRDETTRSGDALQRSTIEERKARRERRHDSREIGRAKRAEHLREVLGVAPDEALPALERLTDEPRGSVADARNDRTRRSMDRSHGTDRTDSERIKRREPRMARRDRDARQHRRELRDHPKRRDRPERRDRPRMHDRPDRPDRPAMRDRPARPDRPAMRDHGHRPER